MGSDNGQEQAQSYVTQINAILPSGFYAAYLAVAKMIVGDDYCNTGDKRWQLGVAVLGFALAVAYAHVRLRMGNKSPGGLQTFRMDIVIYCIRALVSVVAFLGLALLTPPTTQCLYFEGSSPSMSAVPMASHNILLALLFVIINMATLIPGLVTEELAYEKILPAPRALRRTPELKLKGREPFLPTEVRSTGGGEPAEGKASVGQDESSTTEALKEQLQEQLEHLKEIWTSNMDLGQKVERSLMQIADRIGKLVPLTSYTALQYVVTQLSMLEVCKANTATYMWATFGVLTPASMFTAVVTRNSALWAHMLKQQQQTGSSRSESQLTKYLKLLASDLWPNAIRAAAAGVAFGVLAVFDNPLRDCWLGWSLPEWVDLSVLAAVYIGALLLASLKKELLKAPVPSSKEAGLQLPTTQ